MKTSQWILEHSFDLFIFNYIHFIREKENFVNNVDIHTVLCRHFFSLNNNNRRRNIRTKREEKKLILI
jgi:hypothetical protein